MTYKPTPKEIDLLVRTYLGDCGPQANRVYSFVTAVLAKWGQPAQQAQQAQQAPAGAADANYHLIDRFLRINLYDDDYAEYSAALDALASTPAQPTSAPMSPANRLVAYSAATRLRELGFEWDATAEAGLQPAQPAPPPPPECETEAEKRAFAFGWFKALESERMKADSELEDAARWREHVGKLDALVAYCPTCCQGFIAKQDMTRDEVLFACGKAVGQSGAKRLREALDLAVDHIDMDALRISHCKDAAVIDIARKQGGAT